MTNIMLNREISKVNAYELKELKKGYKIPIISDVMFHTMLNNESRKKYVCYLISLSLDMDYKKVYDSIVFVNNKLEKEKYSVSSKTVDFVCKIDNEIIGIEMNNNRAKASLERNISYAADLYKSKMIKGAPYEYQKVIQININNFSFKGNEKTIERYSLRNEKGEIFTDKLIFIHIYLPNIRKKCYNKEGYELNELERLLLIFNEEEGLEKLCKGSKIMEEYVKDSIDASMEDEVIGLYDKELHLEKLRLSEIKETKEKGIEIGMKQGIKEGIEVGKEEEKLSIAKNLLKDNVSIDIISSSTGLSIETIKNLQKK